MRISGILFIRSAALGFEGNGCWVKILAISLLPLLLAGCIRMESLATRTSPSPKTIWTPPPEAAAKAIIPPAVRIPVDLEPSRQHWTLRELVDIGLGNNMETRLAWGAARSAAAAYGAARASFFPALSADLSAIKTKGSAAGGRLVFDYSSLTPSVSLSYLLFDFGGRGGFNEEARRTLEAANWMQNSSIQNVILQIEQSYFQYIAAKSLLNAQEASLKEAKMNLEAAEARHTAGVATLADVLQARTAFSRVQLNLVATEGLLQVLKGSLANAVGLPANTSFEVADELPVSLPLDQVSGEIERFVAEAQAKRPDFAAARALAFRADAHVKTVQSEGLPTIVFNGSLGRVYYNTPAQSNSLSAVVGLDIPLFRGFANAYQVLQAKSDAENAKAQMKKVELDIILQVCTSYYNVRTAAQSVKTAQDLFDSAWQSYEVVLATYKEGVGSILELLAAQSALENGRLQLVQSKGQWLTSLVQFARDTGTLDFPGKTQADPGSVMNDKGVQ
jgi:outer membrane protein